MTRRSGPSRTTCPLKPSTKNRRSTVKLMKPKKAIMTKRMTARKKKKLPTRTKQMQMQMQRHKRRRYRLTLRLQAPQEQCKRKRQRRRRRKGLMIANMTLTTMRKAGISGARKETTGSSITKKTRRRTSGGSRQCQK